jgi:GTP-binding protein YchF
VPSHAGQEVTVGDFSKTVHRASIKVPDDRVERLAEIVKPKKIIFAEIELLDAPGLSGRGKEAAVIEVSDDLRLAEAVIMVVDSFSGTSDPRTEIQSLIDEMILLDAAHIESLLERKTRRAKLSGDKSEARVIETFKHCLSALEDERPIIELDLPDDEEKRLRGFDFLTAKPVLLAVNIGEDDLSRAEEIRNGFADLVSPGKREVVVLCGEIERELVGLDPEERKAFMDDLGIASPAMDMVIQTAYRMLGLVSYLTHGDKEVRAWTIPEGTSAQKAGGAIHSDIERGFIRAEVTTFEDFMEFRTQAALKAAGKLRLEGKDYMVHDGDVILFRFNV